MSKTISSALDIYEHVHNKVPLFSTFQIKTDHLWSHCKSP